MRGWHRRRASDERGTVLVVVSIAMVAMIGATALAVDIGQVTNNNRTLQARADAIALDTARAVNGETAAVLSGSTGAATVAAQASATRNGFSLSGLTLELGTTSGMTFTSIATPILNGAIQNVNSTDIPTAVRVTTRGTVDFAFRPGGTTTSRVAVAQQDGRAGISVGSFLARVDTTTGLLNTVLGGMIGGNLTLVGYTGIAAGSVNLGQLKTQLGFGTVDELLDANITYKNFLNATAAALNAKGDAVSLTARAGVLELATAASSSLSLKLRDLIKVAQGDGNSAASADINVFQLAQMAAQVANGSNALSVTLSTSSLGGLGGLLNSAGNSVQLKVIEPPQIAIGPAAQNPDGTWKTTAKTAQIRLSIHLRPLGTVLGGVLNLPIYVEAASAEASLRGITCATPKDSSTVSVHTDAQAVSSNIGEIADINASVGVVADATILNVINLVRVTGRSNVALAGSAHDLTFHGPFNPANRQTVGSTTLDLGDLLQTGLTTSVQIIGLVLINVQLAVLNILNPILDALDDGLLDPLMSGLGVIVGGADVTNFSLDCNPLKLVS
jgi:tight adherence protein G